MAVKSRLLVAAAEPLLGAAGYEPVAPGWPNGPLTTAPAVAALLDAVFDAPPGGVTPLLGVVFCSGPDPPVRFDDDALSAVPTATPGATIGTTGGALGLPRMMPWAIWLPEPLIPEPLPEG